MTLKVRSVGEVWMGFILKKIGTGDFPEIGFYIDVSREQ
jgi:hypothetical protein